MSKNYHHLSPAQRYQLEVLFRTGKTQKEIAQLLAVHPSTVCRELKRNIPSRGRGSGVYDAEKAQHKAKMRHKQKPKAVKMNPDIKKHIAERLKVERYSPELISVEGKKQFGDFVSHELIYQWIWKCKKGNRRVDRTYKNLYSYLAHGRRRHKRGNRRDNRGIIPYRIPIDQRPPEVNLRQRVGDIEVDLMMGKAHKGALLVMTDRATLLTKLRKLDSKEADLVDRSICKAWNPFKELVKTLTFDNDQAFSLHQRTGSYLNAETYFTRPYTSQDKGTVENRIGLVRRFFPKGTDLMNVTHAEVTRVQNLINNRPIRKHNYKTANQVFSEKIALMT